MDHTRTAHLATAVSTLGEGDAEPALVLPGGPCRGPEYLDDLAGLGSDRPLVVMHPRGTPRTGGLSRGWWNDADDVFALADALELEAIDLVGHSAGTRLALATAVRNPGRVRSLLLITPPATWLTGTPYDGEIVGAHRRDDPDLAAAIASLRNGPATTEQEFQRALTVEAPAGYARWTDTERAHAAVGAMSLAAASAWFTDIPDDAAAHVRAADLPRTLVIGGEQDLLTGLRPVRAFAETLGARFAGIADCGHYPWVEQPAAFRAIAGEWLTTGR